MLCRLLTHTHTLPGPVLLLCSPQLSIIIMLMYTLFFMAVIIGYKFTLSAKVGYTFFGGYLVYVIWTLLTMLEPAIIKI